MKLWKIVGYFPEWCGVPSTTKPYYYANYSMEAVIASFKATYPQATIDSIAFLGSVVIESLAKEIQP